MKSIRQTAAQAMVGLCLLGSVSSGCWALSEGRGVNGEPYVTGGVGEEERTALTRQRQNFNLWITTVASRSGAYLSDARINVVDAAKRQQVLSVALDGPLMFIKLAPGRYTIEALFDLKKQERDVAIGAGGHRELYFYFDVAADTLPKVEEAGEAPKTKR